MDGAVVRGSAPVGVSVRGARVVKVAAGLVLVETVVVLLGWAGGLEGLTTLGMGSTSMKLNTALCLGGLSVSLLSSRPWVGRSINLGATVIAAASLAEYVVGPLGIDELLVSDPAPGPTGQGRIAVTTGVCILVLAGSGAMLATRRPGWSQPPALVAAVVAWVAVLGYAYGAEDLHGVGAFQPMAMPTALAVLVVAVAQLVRVPGGALPWVLFGRDPGAVLQRQLLPLAVVGLPALGWLGWLGEREGLYGPELGLAIIATFASLSVAGVGLHAGATARATDRDRAAALVRLDELNHELDERVQHGIRQFQLQETRSVLTEDRERIARDFHDHVIQRIFAASLQLMAFKRKAGAIQGDPAIRERFAPERFDDVITELDEATKEARRAIYTLTTAMPPQDVRCTLRDTASRGSLILGLDPVVTVQGETDALPQQVIDELTAVLREALSNVAKHAVASSVEVTLVVSGTEAVLTVADNGRGMPDQLPRSSGVSNLRQRAERLGGTATWSRGEPTGTVLTWRVPLGQE